MLIVETIGRIRREHLGKGKSIKEISRTLHLSRNTVRRILRSGETAFSYDREVQPRPKLGPWTEALDRLLTANAKAAARERLTLIRIYEALRPLGYEGGYDAVRRYARRWGEQHASATAEAYITLTFAPGEAYQFDWSHEIVVIGGVTTTVKVAHVRLCMSRMMFVRAYPRETQEMVFDAHIDTTVSDLTDFYGTSAAAASLAGVAALILSANPDLTPAEVEQIMEETALPMANSAVSGAGLVAVDAAVATAEAAATPALAVTNVTLSAGDVSVAASSLFTASTQNGEAITAYAFMDTGPGYFVLEGTDEPNDQEIDVTAVQLSQLTYQSAPGTTDTLQIRAEDATGWSAWASFAVTAPPLVIQTDTSSFGSTSVTEVANQFYLYNSEGIRPGAEICRRGRYGG